MVPPIRIAPSILSADFGRLAEEVRAAEAGGAARPGASPPPRRPRQAIRAAGANPAVALNPATPLSAVEWVLGDCEMVLLMTVNPGFGGQRYIDACTEKVRRLREMADARGQALEIEVDGGVNSETVPRPSAAGANVIELTPPSTS